MSFINFKGTNFTLNMDENGEPWLVAKEFCDYLERCRDTLIRQVGKPNQKMAYSHMRELEAYT